MTPAIQANELSRQLLVFGRKQRLKLQELSLNDVVNQSERLLRRLIREDIDIEIRLHPLAGAGSRRSVAAPADPDEPGAQRP